MADHDPGDVGKGVAGALASMGFGGGGAAAAAPAAASAAAASASAASSAAAAAAASGGLDPQAAAALEASSGQATFKVYVIDTSGSMSDPAQVQTSPGKYESTGQNFLELVTQAAAAAASVMTPAQAAGAVSFSQRAAVVARVAEMDEGARAAMKAGLLRLHPEGSTNIWAALETAADLLLPHFRIYGATASYAVDLLTDGCPNVDPPNLAGYVASLRDYKKRADGFLPVVNTYGFGYNCDVPLLEEIARETGGHFYFLPSPDMVATNFVNSSAFWGAQEAPRAIDAVSDRWRLELVQSLRAMYRSCQLAVFPGAQAEVRRLS